MKATTTTMKAKSGMILSRLMLPLCIDPATLPIAGTTPTTMPAKMMSEIPLPTPRSLICSPSHMTKAVPVVSVITVINRKPQPGKGTSGAPAGPD